MTKKVLSTSDVAKILDINPGSMRRLPLEPIGKIGKTWVYDQVAVEEFAKTYRKGKRPHNNSHMKAFHTCPHCGRRIRGIVYERHIKVCPDTYNIEQAARVLGVGEKAASRLLKRHGLVPLATVYPAKHYSKTIVDLLAKHGVKYDD